MESTRNNHYDLVARVYDLAAHSYSGGQIRASKEAQLPDIQSGDKVLYAGAGSGHDAALAALRGAQVTVVELAPAMAERCRQTFARHGVDEQVELIEGDVFEHVRPGYYNAVAANFFLNVFSPPLMRRLLVHLCAQLKPGGKLLIADFSPPKAASLERWAQHAYFRVACSAFRLLARNADHPLYDYREEVGKLGLDVAWMRDFPIFGLGPAWYRSIVAVKPA